ncbi:hypothetical protein FOA43_000352 [Brettanomyces nanus]|uniref:D-xylose 1-dehydrogenase (NADP(+), D-xylono-1,5-lactone-forming) n=1 Tax=Eeniella nana TaxID=13502 RepID=A0A875RWW9_EENNA|nr:uncharacterized protein FOA43_000352 [Brettanomyces nanus]QPG73048.1 hypothetical protein FOA43_000352 [Brettanomyces nanus]
MSSPFVVNWGVMGPGRIATLFVNDFLNSKDPLRKSVLDKTIEHRLVAVASSSSVDRAQKFKDESIHQSSNEEIKCYGSYDEIYDDPKVDIIYIATPNMTHFKLCYQALTHGKHVLLEKPFTINHRQCEILTRLAKEKHLFLMEAYWTKFNPVYREICDYLFGSKECDIGTIERVISDLSMVFPRNDPGMERIYKPELGGGVIMDIGIYALYWALGFLDKDNKQAIPQITSFAHNADTGVDISTAAILKYGNGTLAVSTCSGIVKNEGHDVLINCTKGRVIVDQASHPTEYWIYDNENKQLVHKKFEFDGEAMYFEADHVAECLSKGLTESPLHTMAHAARMSKILDTIRKQVGNVYSETLESVGV